MKEKYSLIFIGLGLSILSFCLYFFIENISKNYIIIIASVDFLFCFILLFLEIKSDHKFFFIILMQALYLLLFLVVGGVISYKIHHELIDLNSIYKILIYGIFTLPAIYIIYPIIKLLSDIL